MVGNNPCCLAHWTSPAVYAHIIELRLDTYYPLEGKGGIVSSYYVFLHLIHWLTERAQPWTLVRWNMIKAKSIKLLSRNPFFLINRMLICYHLQWHYNSNHLSFLLMRRLHFIAARLNHLDVQIDSIAEQWQRVLRLQLRPRRWGRLR